MTFITSASDVAAHLAYLAPYDLAPSTLAAVAAVACSDDAMEFLDANDEPIATVFADGALEMMEAA
jgi:hypothetical protein